MERTQVIEIQISQLRPHPDNEKLLPPLSADDFAELRRSMAGGLKPIPLEVLRAPGGFIVLDGNNRLKILRETLREDVTIPCIVLGSTDDWPIEQQRTTIQKINLARRHLSLEQKKEIARQMAARGESAVNIAKVVGLERHAVEKAAAEVIETRDEAVKEVIVELSDLGLSQRKIAKVLGVDQKTVGNKVRNFGKNYQNSPVEVKPKSLSDLISEAKDEIFEESGGADEFNNYLEENDICETLDDIDEFWESGQGSIWERRFQNEYFQRHPELAERAESIAKEAKAKSDKEQADAILAAAKKLSEEEIIKRAAERAAELLARAKEKKAVIEEKKAANRKALDGTTKYQIVYSNKQFATIAAVADKIGCLFAPESAFVLGCFDTEIREAMALLEKLGFSIFRIKPIPWTELAIQWTNSGPIGRFLLVGIRGKISMRQSYEKNVFTALPKFFLNLERFAAMGLTDAESLVMGKQEVPNNWAEIILEE